MKTMNNPNKMMFVDQVKPLITSGQRLLIAGTEDLLRSLPAGNWVGGTINYFMTNNGGVESHDQLQVTILPPEIEEFKILKYSSRSLQDIPVNYYSNGFSFIIIPAFSETHQTFAKDCSTWSGIFNQPLVGWISGFDLSQEKLSAKVINGLNLEVISDAALVMHLKLKDGVVARANIMNLFKQGSGDAISFPTNGFEVDTCFINGIKTQFSDYITKHKIDFQLPLVANYMGAMVNVSLKENSVSSSKVTLYAPVFPEVEYRFAAPIANYETEFNKLLDEHPEMPLYSCNCILNFLYANLKGKQTGNLIYAMTFGEIAYMLLNQTFVYITIDHK